MATPNFFLVGKMDKPLAAAGLVTLVPFLVMAGLCIPHMEWSVLGEYNLTGSNFGDMMQNLFWNLNGYDSISTAAGEVSTNVTAVVETEFCVTSQWA